MAPVQAPQPSPGARPAPARVVAVAAATVLSLALFGCGGQTPTAPETGATAPTTTAARAFRGKPALGASTAEDFALRDQDGKVVRLSAQRGKFVLLTFLYTACPDVCPLIASNLNAAVRALRPAQRREVQVIAISVDPRRDTRAAVRAYVRTHRLLPEFRFLIGSRSDLQPIWQGYNVLVDERDGEVASHSTYVLVLDRRGKPRLYYSSHVSAADVLHDLRRLMSAT